MIKVLVLVGCVVLHIVW